MLQPSKLMQGQPQATTYKTPKARQTGFNLMEKICSQGGILKTKQ